MKRERIEALVTKNSGGSATYAKIEAARALRIEVVIVRRPPAPKPKRCTISTPSWPGSPLIAGPHRRAASTSRPRAVARDEARLARADDDQRRHVGEASGRFAERRQGQRLVGAPDRAGECDRRRRRFHASQQVERLLMRAGLACEAGV